LLTAVASARILIAITTVDFGCADIRLVGRWLFWHQAECRDWENICDKFPQNGSTPMNTEKTHLSVNHVSKWFPEAKGHQKKGSG